jgi:outer membrane protein
MKKQIIILMVMAHSGLLLAQQEGADTLYFTLDEAVAFAMENNLNAQNARLDVDAADQRVWETAATGLPQISASASYNYNINLPTTLIPDFANDPTQKIPIQFGTKHNASAGVLGNQLLFSGEYIIGLQTARIFKEFTQRTRERTEQEVRQAVIENYYLVLLGESTLGLLEDNRDNVKQTYEETVQLYKSGFVEEIEADQLEVVLTDLQNSVLSMQRQIMATKNLLKYQMGVERERSIVLNDSLASLVAAIDYTAILGLDFSLEENIDYQILSDQERLAFMDLKLKRTDYMPTLSAFYSMDFAAQRDEFNFLDADQDWYRASMLGLSFNVPIFSSGFRRAGVAQKRIAYEQARNSKVFAAEGLQVEFQQYKYDFANAVEKYRSDKKNLDLSEKVVRVTNTKYVEGLASSLELTQVNNQYLTALTNYTSSMVEVLNAKIKIDQLMNKL